MKFPALPQFARTLTIRSIPVSAGKDQAELSGNSRQGRLARGRFAGCSERSLTREEVEDQVARYSAWLTSEASCQADDGPEAIEYQEQARELVHHKGRSFRTFAPFNRDFSAIQTITVKQAITLIILVLACVLAFFFSWAATLVGSIAVVSTLYIGDLLLSCFLASHILSDASEDRIDDGVVRAIGEAVWPHYTVLCPLYREAVIVPQFVQAMQVLDYPTDKLQVLFLTEEDDAETRDAILAMELPAHFYIITVPDGQPRTKPRACNFGLLQATGDYVVIFDAEDVPDPLQLKKAVLAFAHHSPETACIQAKLNFYNPTQNVLTRWFTAEYSVWFDFMLPALQRLRVPLPLGGTSNHFRTTALRRVGGWDPFNVTEDCDLGLRLAHYHLQTAILDSTTYEEANPRLKNWLRQRSRWIKGYMQTYLVHMRSPLRYMRAGAFSNFLGLQFVVGARILLLFINPLMWLLIAIYVVFEATVLPFYHLLYPRPVLYFAAASLIFGNFFYVYTYLIGCIKRKHYSLMKWALLTPFYWGLMSVAASIALVQLVFKPHYWEKTQHGLHLQALTRKSKRQKKAASTQKAAQSTKLATVNNCYLVDLPIATVADTFSTWRMCAIQSTLAAPAAVALTERPSKGPALQVDLPATRMPRVPKEVQRLRTRGGDQRRRIPRTRDRWLGLTILTATLSSLVAFWYSFDHQLILLLADSYSHMRIARSIFDSTTPGIGQFGGVWLPLPHIIMLPLIWDNDLWRTGLAGSFSSMPCYVVASIYVFLTARRLTRNSPASFVGALVFILNPNVLYLQTTPLTEPVLMATMSAACYYFLAWVQDGDANQLILAAGAMFLATLARYDGWALFLACLALIVPIGWLKGHRRPQIGANLLLFGTLGGFGIALWFLWCGVIFHDPLYFQDGPYSSQAQQMSLYKAGGLYTYHDLWKSLSSYALASIETLGPMLFGLVVVAVAVFLVRRWRSPETLGALVLLVPFAFYVISLYSGQAAIYIPGAVPANAPSQLYNTRYGVEVVAPAAIFLATLVSRLSLAKTLLLAAIVTQTVLTFQGGVISLQEGQYGLTCWPTSQISIYLAEHYNGGSILNDVARTYEDYGGANIDFKNVIYQGSGASWQQALKNPGSLADWVVMQPGDDISRAINVNSPIFQAQFALAERDGSIELFHRRGLPPLPSRSVPASMFTMHSLCRRGNAGPGR